MITHLYKYICAHPISMSTFKRLSQFDLEIHKVGHQERIAIDDDIGSH
jgi:hypothetical protein